MWMAIHQLPDVGISLSDLTWTKVKVSADHWICVRQTNRTVSNANCSCSRRSSNSSNDSTINRPSRSNSIVERTRFSLSDEEDGDDSRSRSSQLIANSNPIYIPFRTMTRSKTLDHHFKVVASSLPSNGHVPLSGDCDRIVPQVTLDTGSIDSFQAPDYSLPDSMLSGFSIQSTGSNQHHSNVTGPSLSTQSLSTSSKILQSTALLSTQRSAPIQISSQSSSNCANNNKNKLLLNINGKIPNSSPLPSLHGSRPACHPSPIVRLTSTPSSIEVKQMRAQNRLMVKSNSFNTLSKDLPVSSSSAHASAIHQNCSNACSANAVLNQHAPPIDRLTGVRLKPSKSSHNLCATSSVSSTASSSSSASLLSAANPDSLGKPAPCSRCQSVLSILNPYDARLRHFSSGRIRCAVLNPCRPLLVSSVGQLCSINCLRTGKCIRRVQLPQRITFLSWLSPAVVALITSTRIYHWDFGVKWDSLPKPLFPLHPRIASNQIVSYETDETGQWFALNTVSHDSGKFFSNPFSLINYHVERSGRLLFSFTFFAFI